MWKSESKPVTECGNVRKPAEKAAKTAVESRKTEVVENSVENVENRQFSGLAGSFPQNFFPKVFRCGKRRAAICAMSYDKTARVAISPPVSTFCPAFSAGFAGGFQPEQGGKARKKPPHRRKKRMFPVFHSLHTPYYDYYDLSIFYSVFLFLSASAERNCRNAHIVLKFVRTQFPAIKSPY